MENMGVGKNLCMPLKLSDVFGAEKNTQAKDSNHSLGKTNNKDCKEKSRSILNKYRITEINKGGIVDIKVRNTSCTDNIIGRGNKEELEKDDSTDVKSKSGKEADLEESSKIEPEESSKVGPEESSKRGPEESSKRGPEESSKRGPEESSKIEPEESSKVGPEENSKVGPEESSKGGPEESSKIEPEESSKGGPEESSKIEPEESSKVGPEESSKGGPEESSKIEPEESSKIGPEESSKEVAQGVAPSSSDNLDERGYCRKGVGEEGERAVIKDVVRRKAYKQSNMLIANGTVGLIVHNGIMCLAKRGNEVFILTSIKKSFCVYDQHKLKKAYCSNYFSEDIKELHAANNCVYVLFKRKVYKVNDKEGKKIFSSNCHKYDIINMLTVSDYLLTYSKKEIVIWHDERGEIKEEEGDKVEDSFFVNSDRYTSSEESDESEGELHRTGEHIKRKNLTNKCSSFMCEDKVSGVQGQKRETTLGEQASGNPESGEECREVKNESTNYVYKVIELFDENSHFEIKQIFHPDGYTNKVIILTNEDKIYLYNINKEKIIHEYNSVEQLGFMTYNTSDFKDIKFDSRGKRIKMMSLTEQNREICIVTFTNEIHIMDIEKDEIIYSKNIHMNDDYISCVHFYSYKKDGENICIIFLGTLYGKILMLKKKGIDYFFLRNIHNNVKTILISPQGYIYTSGYDNKINLLRLNINTFTLEIVKKRNSCIGIINNIKYYDDENYKIIISANIKNKKEGNLFIINPNYPEQNLQLWWNKKINISNRYIIDFDINMNRHYDWDNILICLQDSHRIYLGSSYRKIISNAYLKLPNSVIFKEDIFIVDSLNGKKKKGKYSSINGHIENYVNSSIKVKTGVDGTFYGKTKPAHIYAEDYNIYEKDDSCDSNTNFEDSHAKRAKREKHATSVLISTCGHIGIVGYKGGEIHSFNIQSRNYRSEYKINKYSIKSKAHTHGDILKLYLYGVNHFVSATNSHKDPYLRVWNLYTSELVYAYNVVEALGRGSHGGENSSQVGYSQGGNLHGGDRHRGVSIVSLYQCNILTVVCLSNDYTLVLDIEQKCVTRKFHFACSVTYVTFSKDNRLILFSLKNRTLLLYEIISNTFVDYILFQNEILSMIYNDIHLYTAHGKSPHFLYSFTNKNLFNNNNYVVSDYKLFNAIPIDEFVDSDNQHCNETYNLKQLTNANDEMGKEDYTTFFAREEGNNDDVLLNQDKNNYIHVMQSYKSSEKQISRNLLTMSGFNISKIAYLIFLDKIKENCRVEENVKKNQDIPFFLSAKLDTNIQYVDTKEKEFLQNIMKNNTDTGGLENQKEEEEKEAGETAEEVTKDAIGEDGVKQEGNHVKSRIILKNRRKKQNFKIEMPGSKLQQILGKSEPTYIDALKYLKSLSPSGVHFNILCLSTKEELENMMNFFIYHVKTNDNIDLIQAYILIFLKAHGKKLMRTKEKNLRNSTKVLLQEIQGSWSSINLLFENIIFFIKFLTNIQLE
ncbi:U3 small nucleolar RNA-associated protein 21, putative (UTP21) [Plasmodium ovale curtisi]|uniref:U3 small nucleolar RNA-associated protein 21, putative (UTP21) n=1 Tax=Plasmodium ovale curtisi TaxID=864141 RepID=A0A1A8W1J4_PLAOA|nr:U3 small nucleolar RNA-associated protein 21, putative (UTP21) [Plasmodium ovale curtisi]SBS93764.1 U3 small nucleolar RNA-associated protein 21, putative (UTP21) [Plasmodium ovale curtisi]